MLVVSDVHFQFVSIQVKPSGVVGSPAGYSEVPLLGNLLLKKLRLSDGLKAIVFFAR